MSTAKGTTGPPSSTPMLDSFSTSLRHVVENILKADESSEVVKAIHDEEISEIDDLLIIERDFKTYPLVYQQTPSSPPCPIPVLQRYILTRLLNFCAHYLHDNDYCYLTEDEWLNLIQSNIKAYCTPRVLPPRTTPYSPAPSRATTPSKLVRHPVPNHPPGTSTTIVCTQDLLNSTPSPPPVLVHDSNRPKGRHVQIMDHIKGRPPPPLFRICIKWSNQ